MNKRIRNFFILSILFALSSVVFTFSACNDEPDTPPIPPPTLEKTHTLILFFQGNNSLQSYLVTNVNKTLEAMDSRFPDGGRIFLFFDSKAGFGDNVDDSTSVLFELHPSTGGNEATMTRIKSYGNQDSTDPGFIKSVLNEVKTISPSDEYGIVMSSHGMGWFPVGAGVQYENIPGTGGIINQGIEHDFRKPENGEYVTRYYGQDGSEWMDIADIAEGLSAIDFDYIIFDACFMSSVEVLYDLRHSAKYIIASPSEIMGYGFPFDRFIPVLFEGGSIENRLSKVGSTFYEYYNAGTDGNLASASIAVVETAKLDALAASVKNLFEAGVKEVDETKVQALESMSSHAFFDLKDYLSQLSTDQTAYSNFEKALSDAIIYSNHTQSIYSAFNHWFVAKNVCGITSYIPRDRYPNNKGFYYETAWAKFTQPDGDVPKETPKDHTLILFFQGNNTLLNYLAKNVEKTYKAMKTNFPSDRARIFLFFDGNKSFGDYTGSATSVLYELVTSSGQQWNATAKYIKAYGEKDSTDPEFVKSVLNDIKAISDTEEYGIVMSSHATGWFPESAELFPQSIRGKDGSVAGFSLEHDFSKENARYLTRTYAEDGGKHMEISDVVEALSVIDFDYIIFDSCLMSSIEVLYDLRYSAEYIIASPSEVMGYGFPFEQFIPQLFKSGTMRERLTNVAETYYDFYSTTTETINSGSVALIETAKIDPLAASVKNIFAAGIKEVDVSKVQALESMTNHAFYDLKDYLSQISVSQTAYSDFEKALSDAVIYTNTTDELYSGYNYDAWFPAGDNVCGISSYIPRDEYPNNRGFYYETAWAQYIHNL